MCKQCELRGIKMTLRPIDMNEAREAALLPKAWQELLKTGFFHEDITDRVRAHLFWTKRAYSGHPEESAKNGNASAFVSALAKGFLSPFERKLFAPKAGDQHYALKNRFLDAIGELSDEFKPENRISSVLWNSLAHLGTRDEPEESRSILKEADILPHHYGIVDTHLHALGKVYSLKDHVNSVIFRHTGCILNHNCDCDCSLVNLTPIDGKMEVLLPKTRHYEATQSLSTHLLAESELILNCRLPFEYSITKEAQLLLGIECEL